MTNVKKTKASIKKARQKLIKRDHLVRLQQVAVKDNGKGILENPKIHLLDRLYRFNRSHIHRSSEEASLGSAIAEAIVKNHQRQIIINSSLNQRTILTLISSLNYSKSDLV
ncbi:MAG: ATP-binding protein [cyanobacterium endosymbiont of Epithemia adnata isolate EadnSB Bon19]|jgi:signal transduction histidine kinase